MTGNPPLIDTNILVYLFDADAPEKREASRALVERCWRHEAEYSVSVQNLAEFSVVVTEKVEHPMPTDDVRRFVSSVTGFDGWHVVGYDGATLAHALTLRDRHHIHFWDALLVATMLAHGIDTIVTEDAHLAGVSGITAVNPFRD
jgi:predicted nucleic acid-binding protein